MTTVSLSASFIEQNRPPDIAPAVKKPLPNPLNTNKQGFDNFWKTRRGVKPQFLFRFWDEINAEIDAADTLS
jgi:hypothetical protein